MFNIIRQTPYLAGDGRGGVSYFVGGHGNQIAVETQIIALVYAALAFAVIALITKAPTIKNPNTQTLYILIMSALILVVFSYLMSRFKIKNGGYPFQILNIF
jgi:oligosaccharyltransferase complex subunit gamma